MALVFNHTKRGAVKNRDRRMGIVNRQQKEKPKTKAANQIGKQEVKDILRQGAIK